jgi:hypothetical protein
MSANPFDDFEKNINISHDDEDAFGDFQTSPNIKIDSDTEENSFLYIGEKHISLSNDYYDIKLSKSFDFIKLYHANRNIDSDRTKEMVIKYKTKPINFPPLIIAHIVDTVYDKDEYVLIDGQHRYFSMKQLFMENNIDTIFTYKLYECKSVEELEELFTDINCNIKFENMFPYKKTGKLIDKIEAYFKTSVSRAKNNRDYKFNPDKLKMKLVDMKFFETYDYTVDEVFSKIIELNEKTCQKYYKLKLEKKLPKYNLNFLEHIELAKKNVMYLLFEREKEFEWLDFLVKML